MSSDLLEHLGQDDSGSVVLLTQRASGDCWLSVSGDSRDDYHIPATEQGIKNARDIATALTMWADRMKQCNLVRSEPPAITKEDDPYEYSWRDFGG